MFCGVYLVGLVILAMSALRKCAIMSRVAPKPHIFPFLNMPIALMKYLGLR
jgi:hypothetical protein